MENEKKLKQPVQQLLSGEKQREFNKMAILKKAAEEAKKPTQKYQAMTDEEVMEALLDDSRVSWRRPKT